MLPFSGFTADVKMNSQSNKKESKSKSSKAIDQEIVYEEGQIESFTPTNDDKDDDSNGEEGEEDNLPFNTKKLLKNDYVLIKSESIFLQVM